MVISSQISAGIGNPWWNETPEREQTIALEGDQIAAPLAEPIDSLYVLVYSPSSDSSPSELDLPIAHRKGIHSTINTKPIYTSPIYSHVLLPTWCSSLPWILLLFLNQSQKHRLMLAGKWQ